MKYLQLLFVSISLLSFTSNAALKTEEVSYQNDSVNMKGFIACCLACVPEMVKADLKRPIYFAFSYVLKVHIQQEMAQVLKNSES